MTLWRGGGQSGYSRSNAAPRIPSDLLTLLAMSWHAGLNWRNPFYHEKLVGTSKMELELPKNITENNPFKTEAASGNVSVSKSIFPLLSQGH